MEEERKRGQVRLFHFASYICTLIDILDEIIKYFYLLRSTIELIAIKLASLRMHEIGLNILNAIHYS